MKGMIWISDQWQRKPWRSRWNYLVKMSGEIDGEMGWEKRRESRVSAGRLGRVCDGRRRWRKSVDSPTIVVPSIPLPPCLLSGEESGRRNSYRNNILESTLGNPSSPPPRCHPIGELNIGVCFGILMKRIYHEIRPFTLLDKGEEGERET